MQPSLLQDNSPAIKLKKEKLIKPSKTYFTDTTAETDICKPIKDAFNDAHWLAFVIL